ncbi:ABC transporter permease [Paenibacillus sp. HB172176]|uniref:ABC transporter permease n=1 Tax=Paenibacillus sp. HB172176 TaxID=2493690 RepID=UPI00143B4DD5|nr:ABC transporter permease [Paenibacillus sp. HB172176]
MESNVQAMKEPVVWAGKSKEPSRTAELWNAFLRRKTAVAASVILLIIVLSCLAAPLLTAYDPYEGEVSERLLPIGSPSHLLGTDEQGRDLLSRILYGGRYSLLSGIAPILMAVVIGGGLGIIAGYFKGILNTVIMRSLDIVYSFPAILLAIGISASLGPGMSNIIISATIVFIPPIARIAETAVKEVGKEEYIEAAVSSGASSGLIIRFHIIKNIFNRLFVYSTTQIGICLILASGLSFLGLGVAPPTPEWGFMLNNLKQVIFIDPIVTIVPGLFIFLTSLSMNVFSDALSDVLDSKG